MSTSLDPRGMGFGISNSSTFPAERIIARIQIFTRNKNLVFLIAVIRNSNGLK
jgi:hypothetical protein